MPKVSINLCCYNSERYLRATLDSVLSQTYRDWELVIIDDGSTDSTAAIVSEYSSGGAPIVFRRQENRGLGYSRNQALALSTGDIIAFIDHDDLWAERKLEKQVQLFDARPDVAFVYSNYEKLLVNRDNKRTVGFRKRPPEGNVFAAFVKRYEVSVSTVAVRRKALASLSHFFDERLVQIEEYDLFMRLLYGHRAAYIDEVLATYRIHRDMMTLKAPELVPDECQRLLENFHRMDPGFSSKHPKIVDFLETEVINYNRAKRMVLDGQAAEARKLIKSSKRFSFKLLLCYLATLFPKSAIVGVNQMILRARAKR